MYFTEMSFYNKDNVLKYYSDLPNTEQVGLTDWGLFRTYKDDAGLQIQLIHAKNENDMLWVKAYYTNDLEAQRLCKGIPRVVLESLAPPTCWAETRWINIASILN
jgi:hypothetical protein